MASADIYQRFSRHLLSEDKLKKFDFPRKDATHGDATWTVKLYGDHFGFKEGCCKRCDKRFDTTYVTPSGPCDYHLERAKRYGGRWHPHGCCGKSNGSLGCRHGQQHVHKGCLYLDLDGYKETQQREQGTEAEHVVYAMDTESVHSKNGLEVCRVTVVDTKLDVVYDKFCLPTSDIIDYNTVWSGITEEDLPNPGTMTFDELRDELLELISADTILVGHGLNSDLISVKIIHNKVVDTVDLYPHPRGPPLRRSLKDITQKVLGQSIQDGEGHSSEDDAKMTMRLALKRV